jgi:integrase
MPKIALTDITLRNLPAPEKGQQDIWDVGFPAFGVRVSQGGSKTFVLNIHNSRRAIGRYPVITLAQARSEARRMLAEKTLGKTKPVTITYQEALRLFLAEKEKTRRASTYKNHKFRLTTHFNFKGQLADLTHHEVARRLARIRTTAEQDHALSVAKTFFTWCHNHRYIDDNPTRGLSAHGSTSRARVLTDVELRQVWIASDGVGEHFGTIVKLLILTGQRRGEIAALQSSWINDNTITLPASVTKNGRQHTVPLGTLGTAIVQAANSDTHDRFLFPARGRTSSNFNGWSKSKSTLDKASGVKDWMSNGVRLGPLIGIQKGPLVLTL